MTIRQEHVCLLLEVLRLGLATTDQIAIGTGHLDGGVRGRLLTMRRWGLLADVTGGNAPEPVWAVTSRGLTEACIHDEVVKSAARLARRGHLHVGKLKLCQRSGMRRRRSMRDT